MVCFLFTLLFLCKVSKFVNENIYYRCYLCYIFYCGACSKYKTKGENKVLKVKNQGGVYRVLSCIFAVIMVVYVLMNRNIIDLVYLGIISMFILKYFIEIRRK